MAFFLVKFLMKILILEGGHSTGHFLQDSSLRDRYELDTARYTGAGSQLVVEPDKNAADYDLIVLDIAQAKSDDSKSGNSNLDGVAICQWLRTQSTETLILLLVEPQDNREVIAAIEAGADDYITKPIDAETLLTRIAFLLHRQKHHLRQQKVQIDEALVEKSPNSTDRFELALRAEESRLTGLANNVPGMMHQYVLRADGTDAFAYVSLGCEEIWEIPPETLLKDAQSAWSLIHPEDVERVQRTIEAAAQHLQPLDFEFRLLPPSGVLRWVRAVSQPERQSNGDVLFNSFIMDVSDRKQAEQQLQKQLDRERLISQITDSIHQTLDLDQILHTAVDQVRHFLQTDRVIVFRFNADWQGVVEAESVSDDWLAILGMNIRDECFNEQYVETYRRGRITTISDVDAIPIHPCYAELLRRVQVRSNLVVPILQEGHLWGLLIAHHCVEPRQWQPESTQLLKQVATQLGIAIQQAELYEATRHELVERREVQAALQASEERFRTLSAFAPVGIYQTDLEGHCIYTNAKWQEIAGMSFEESLGDSWGQAIHPDDRERVFTAWSRLVAGESDFSMEFRFFNALRGEERWVFGQAIAMRSPSVSSGESHGVSDGESHSVSVGDSHDVGELPLIGEIIGYVGVNEDITERRRAEQKNREQAALIDIVTDAIFVCNLAGQITFWSQGSARLYGWKAEEALGKSAQQLLKKRDQATLQEALSTTLEQGFWQGELTQSTKTGNDILVASRWTLVKDDAGRPKFLLEVNTDITEKKQLEALYYQAQKLESLGRLAGGIAHDLGNILTPILGIAQLLRLTLKNKDAATQEQLDILEKSAKRGTQMVRQILTFAQGSPESETTADITTLLREVVDVARQGFPNSIEIRVDIPSRDTDRFHGAVAVDSTHLHQIFMNLCVNARDAMPNGGLLTISLDHVTVTEAIAAKDPEMLAGYYMVITVADTGIGMAADVRDRIFDPFFTTKTPDHGTGLGLATVLGIVKKAGGFLKVSSEVNQGTEINVYFPIVET